MLCSECGAELEQDAKFCAMCGQQVVESGEEPREEQGGHGKPNPPYVTSGKGIFSSNVFRIGVVVVLIALAAAMLWPSKGNPETVAKDFIAALASADGKAIVNLMTQEEIDRQLAYYSSMDSLTEELQIELAFMSVMLGLEYGSDWGKKVEVIKTHLTDTEASFDFELDDMWFGAIDLIKEKGKWKVADFSF
jgi:hypothetical protein|nr:zinc-ribbon domain-containing protein [Bacillota bacterium]